MPPSLSPQLNQTRPKSVKTGQAADPTYSTLPAPGENDPAKLSKLATISQQFRVQSGSARSHYLGNDSDHMLSSTNLYRFGREDGRIDDDRPTVNRVKKTLDSFEASAARVPASIVLKSASMNEEGPWVLKRRTGFTLAAALIVDPETQQPLTDPSTGQPYPDVQLRFNEEIPEELVDYVPAHYRVKIDTATVVKWEQQTFDVIRREIDFDDTARQMVHYKQQLGWLPLLYEWDEVSQRPIFKFFPLQQWYLDPIQTEVARMNLVALDMIIDAAEACRLYPDAIDAINGSASKSIKTVPGSMGYSDLYTGSTSFAAPVVTMALNFLRNIEMPMTLDEATGAGIVEVSHEAPAPDTQGDGAPAGAEETQPQGQPQLPQTPETTPDAPVRKVKFGEHDLSDSFNEQGQPADELHPAHPRKIVTVQWIQIDSVVVPGTYVVCPYLDIPVILDKNSEILFRPFGDPETVYLKSPQNTINAMYEAMVNHAGWFKGPAGFISKEFQAGVDGDVKDSFAEPGVIHTVDLSMLPGGKIADHFLQLQPPPMTAALPQVLDRVTQDYERIADAGVNNGTPPEGVKSGRAVMALQSASQATNDLKSMHTEKALRRGCKLMLHSQVNWMSLDEIMRMNRSVPREIVQTWFMPMRKQILWDVEVSIATGGGAVQQQKENQVRADFAAKMISLETAQDELGYDSEEEKRRSKEEREEIMREQAEVQSQQAANAPQAPQKPPFSLSVSTKLGDMAPEDQTAVLQAYQLPGLPSPKPVEAVAQAGGQPSEQEQPVQQGR